MAVSADLLDPPAGETTDKPRRLDPGLPTGDRVFQHSVRAVGVFVLVLTGSIGVFLGYQFVITVHRYGLRFFTENQWIPSRDILGLSAVLLGTVEVAIIALVVGFPLALLLALFISEYAPGRLRSTLVSLVDLMAAVPSIVFGLWGFFLLQPRAEAVARWLSTYFAWIPFFKPAAGFDPRGAAVAGALGTHYAASTFIAGLCVSMMVIPLACSVMRGVFAEAPIGEREGAAALGGSRWGVIRAVVLPFGQRGIIGGTMLGLGRALGETIAVLLIISPAFDIKIKVLTTGAITTSALIAGLFGDSTGKQLSALLAAGFVLFAMTICINTVAALFVQRSRSGAQTG